MWPKTSSVVALYDGKTGKKHDYLQEHRDIVMALAEDYDNATENENGSAEDLPQHGRHHNA